MASPGVADALADNIERSTEIQRRVIVFHSAIDDGAEVNSLVENEEQPRMVEMLSANLAILEGVRARTPTF